MLKVGLTGGIASGKSAVGEILVRLGTHLIQADTIAHELMQPGTSVYEEVVRHFDGNLGTDGTYPVFHAVLGNRCQAKLAHIQCRFPGATAFRGISGRKMVCSSSAINSALPSGPSVCVQWLPEREKKWGTSRLSLGFSSFPGKEKRRPEETDPGGWG